MSDLSTSYLDFINNLEEKPTKDTMDFLGISFQEKKEDSIFKIYYATRVSPFYREHPLVTFLYGRNMLRDFEIVKDTISQDHLRLDTAIKNRNDTNIQTLFDYLEKKTALFEICKEDIKCIARMQITPLEEHTYASIYHLGITETKESVDSLKWYFFTRWCVNPDKPKANSGYRDEYYLDYLQKTGISEMCILVEEIKKILNLCGGHLWMAAMDVKKSGWRKYKIYVQHIEIDYDKLNKFLNSSFEKKLSELKAWHKNHSEFECNGIALCLDTEGIFSLNFYYSFI